MFSPLPHSYGLPFFLDVVDPPVEAMMAPSTTSAVAGTSGGVAAKAERLVNLAWRRPQSPPRTMAPSDRVESAKTSETASSPAALRARRRAA